MGKSRAATRTIDILDYIAKDKRGVTLSDIASNLDIPITSVSDILMALLDEDMIEVIDERSKLYGIGVRAYYIGNAFLTNSNIIDKARPVVEALGALTNRTVFMGKEINDELTYIYKHETKSSVVSTCQIGKRTTLHNTSLGKAILAYNDELKERLRNRSLVKKTPYTITDFEVLEEQLKEVREKGYAVDDREQNGMLLCIGAPIYDYTGKVIASISVSGLYSETVNVEEIGLLVKEKGLEISKKMGYRE